MKKIFRYPLSTFFLLFGLTVAFVCVFCGCAIFNYTRDLQKELKKYSYRNVEFIGVDASRCSEGIDFKKLKTDVGNGMLNDIEVEIENDKIVLANILININEKTLYELEEGRFISNKDIRARKKVVNIGRNRLDSTYEKKQRKYIRLNGDEYEVIGIIGTRSTKLHDNEVILHYDCLGKNIKEYIKNISGVVYSISSNVVEKEQLEDLSEKIRDSFSKMENISVYDYEKKVVVSSTERKTNQIIFIGLYVLGLLNCIIVSEFWLLNRRNEVVIRLAFGYDKKTLFKMLYGDVLKIATLAAFLGIVCSKIIESFLNSTLEMLLDFSLLNCIEVVIAVLCTTYILTKILLKKIFSKEITEHIMMKGVG